MKTISVLILKVVAVGILLLVILRLLGVQTNVAAWVAASVAGAIYRNDVTVLILDPIAVKMMSTPAVAPDWISKPNLTAVIWSVAVAINIFFI